eukprot:gene17004-22503_t
MSIVENEINNTNELRTDPITILENRKKTLERVHANFLPELHLIGSIISGSDIIRDFTEGAYLRYKIEYGTACEHISGDLIGQTHIAYQHNILSYNTLTYNHPIDIHLAELGISGNKPPLILIQCTRVDWHGRRLISGYGFAHIPTTNGYNKITIPLWRPTGSLEEELDSFFVGRSSALINSDPIYETAWKDRCRLVTTTAGEITIELYTITRHTKLQGIDSNNNVK